MLTKILADTESRSLGGAPFSLDGWVVHSAECLLKKVSTGEEVKITPKSMEVLLYLAEHHGSVVSAEELFNRVWGSAFGGANAVQKCIAEIRKAVQDDVRQPRLVKTVPKRGYQLLLAPAPLDEQGLLGDEIPVGSGTGFWNFRTASGALVLVLSLVAAWSFVGSSQDSQYATSLEVRGTSITISVEENDGTVSQELLQFLFKTLSERAYELDVGESGAEMTDEQFPLRVQLSGAFDQVILTLIPGSSGMSYSDTFPTEGDDFDINALARNVESKFSNNISTLLDSAALEEMSSLGTQSLSAYNLYKQSWHLNLLGDSASHIEAANKLDLALLEDPTFSAAYQLCAGSLFNYSRLSSARQEKRVEAADRILQLIQTAKAARIDDRTIRTIERYRAMILSVSPDHLLERWVEALTSDPNDAEALRRMGNLLAGVARADESRAYLERALSQYTDDNSLFWVGLDYATVLNLEGDKLAHIAAMEDIVEKMPNFVPSLYGLVRANSALNGRAEAEFYLERLRSADTEGQWAYGAELLMLALLGDLSGDDEKLEQKLEDPRASNLARGLLFFSLGMVEEGVGYWQQMETETLPLLWEFLGGMEQYYSPGVVQDPSYQAVLEQLGMGRTWRIKLRDTVQSLSDSRGLPATKGWNA